MTSNSFKYSNYNYISDLQKILNPKDTYKQYLKNKYNIPDYCEIIVKRGFVISKQEKFLEKSIKNSPFKIRQQVYNDIKNDIERIYSLINKAN